MSKIWKVTFEVELEDDSTEEDLHEWLEQEASDIGAYTVEGGSSEQSTVRHL